MGKMKTKNVENREYFCACLSISWRMRRRIRYKPTDDDSFLKICLN
jgi:hypothetical protein